MLSIFLSLGRILNLELELLSDKLSLMIYYVSFCENELLFIYLMNDIFIGEALDFRLSSTFLYN